MDSIWEKLAQQFAGRVESLVAARAERLLKNYFRSSVELVFTEEEAAARLKVSVDTLQRWRLANEINCYQYARRATYSLAHLQDFLSRNERLASKPKFRIKPDISLLGIETDK